MSTGTPNRTRRLVRAGAIGATLAAVGIGAIDAAPISAAASPASTSVVATAAPSAHVSTGAPSAVDALAPTVHFSQSARSSNLVGIFPGPISCAIAGATTGLPFFCGFYFFFWGLNVLQ
jgi:hypothetical protein